MEQMQDLQVLGALLGFIAVVCRNLWSFRNDGQDDAITGSANESRRKECVRSD